MRFASSYPNGDKSTRKGILGLPIAGTPIAILDVETTGLVPGQDRVIEASVIRVEPGGEPTLVFDSLIHPQRRVAATEIHGITDVDVADAPTFEDVAPTLITALSGAVVAAYNVYFDVRFLKHELGRIGFGAAPPYMCLMYLRPMLGLGPRCSLGDACRLYGIVAECEHVAAVDCDMSARLFAFYRRAFDDLGITTFGDLASLGSYLFLDSWTESPIEYRSFTSGITSRPLKPRARQKAGGGRAEPVRELSAQGLRAYWEALSIALSDGEMTEVEERGLNQIQKRFGLLDEQVDLLRDHASRSRSNRRSVGRRTCVNNASIQVRPDALAGKTIVVTGTIEGYTRGEIERLIKAAGGKPTGSVGRKTDFLVVGEDPGSKLDKARELGVEVVWAEKFLKMIER